MRWIESIDWDGRNYGISTITTQGRKEEMATAALQGIKYLTELKTSRIKLKTDFSTWRKESDQSFLSAMGFPTGTQSGQDIYAFESNGKTFHIPAVTLMQALFRPLGKLTPFLFSPQGLENLLVAQPDKSRPVGFFCSVENTLRIVPNRSIGILDAMSWMYCFPSARASWNSVLVNGRAGRLGISLPQATANIVIRAVPHADIMLVADMNIMSLDTFDTPFVFAHNHKRTIDFHRGAHRSADCTVTPKKINLPCRNGNWSISDDEWRVVENVVKNNRPTKHDLRSIIDAVIEKFALGIAWRFIDTKGANKPIVLARYQQMLKDGRWERLLTVLEELRTENSEIAA